MIKFRKYHGAGNDFIIIDDRSTNRDLSAEQIKDLCDRHFGIGADGLIQIRNRDGFDFDMLYYNSDGLPGSMCGNGGRCASAFCHKLGIIGDLSKFYAFDGEHRVKILRTDPYLVSLKMNDVSEIENSNGAIVVDTGSPHYIQFVNDVRNLDVVGAGRTIRNSDRFRKNGINVNFVELEENSIKMRTYERGVEDETLSCGTGVTASVIAASFMGKSVESGCDVHMPGGDLKVYYRKNGKNYTDIWLEGGAEEIFSGEINMVDARKSTNN